MERIRAFVYRNGFIMLVAVCVLVIVGSGLWAFGPLKPQDTEDVEAGSAPGFVQDLAKAKTLSLIRPVEGETLRGYTELAHLPTLDAYGAHFALDLLADAGTPVLAARDGTVTFAHRDSALGGVVVISHEDGMETRYCGLRYPIAVKAGTSVLAGQLLGTVGTMPQESGDPPHLHFETYIHGRTVDPIAYMR